jgi:iron complex transport system permease protein
MSLSSSRYLIYLLVLLLLDLFLLANNLIFGSVNISWHQLWAALIGGEQADNIHGAILWRLRMPNALMTLAAGGGLAVAGLLMQTFFRNPIASPYLLGVSAGGSLGVAVGVFLFQTLQSWAIIGLGAAGSFGVLLLLLAAATRVRQNETLLILGLMMGSAIGAIVELIQYFGNAESLQRFMIWSQGSTQGSTWAELNALLPCILLTCLLIFSRAKSLNSLLLGEPYAQSMGTNTRRLRWQILSASAILAGGVTAFCGPIGFIGIIAPHAARWLFRTAQHQILIPASFLIGIFFLLFATFLAVLLGSQRPLPINALTALMGVPVVVWLVWQGRH